jgi:leader peptidase (prepilin peptidase)/N-methyltransferase
VQKHFEPDLNTVLVSILTLASAPPLGWLAARAADGYAPAKGPPPLVMVGAMALTFGWALLIAPPAPVLLASLALGWCLVCLAAIDLVCFRLPDILVLPLAVAGLAASLWLPGRPILDHVAGAAAGYCALAGLAWLYQLWRRVEGVGLGDAKLLGAAGAWLGWRPLPWVVLLACLVAFAWVGLRALLRRRLSLGERLAFGAPLCLAVWIVWLHGQPG